MPITSIHVRAFLLLSCCAAPLQAQVPLSSTLVASGFVKPLCVTHAPGDATRLYVVEKLGQIKIVQGGAVLGVPFLDMSSLINAGSFEWGLLSMCFDPNFATNGFFYVDYTSGAAGDTHIARFQVTTDPNVVDLATHATVLLLPALTPNHRGGWLGFGGDGFMYVSQGDGGPQEDPFNHAQDTALLMGKILRLDVSGDDFPADPNKNYRIPPTNPFVGQAGVAPEIWALGLRNPWRCSFDRQTFDLWVADVGEYAREEVNFQAAGVGGLNYGWRCTEGSTCTVWGGCTCNGPTLTPPIHDYNHATGRSVTGGYVYRGSAIAGLQGTYIYGDYQLGKFWSLRFDGANVSELVDRTAQIGTGGALSIAHPSSFGEDAQGELYVCDYQDGELFKIVAAPDVTPPSVSIESPTNLANWTALDSPLVVAGVASDNVGVTQVAWVNSRGGAGTTAGTATGTTSWSASIALVPGPNLITITATDGANNSAIDSITVDFQPPPVGFCTGDGSSTTCPCGNVGLSGHGCPNSFDATGALLSFTGQPQLGADTLTLQASGVSNATVSFFQGTTQQNSGQGVAFGDGLRCAGGAVLRLGAVLAANNTAQFPNGGPDTVSTRGMVTTPGSQRTYQVWYRNAAAFCTISTFNLTNGLFVTWGP